MTQPDWDDARLATAFHARFDRPAPQTVARAVHGTIVGTTPARSHAFRPIPARNLAAAAVVVLLVGSVALALSDIGRLGGGPSLPSDSEAAASPGASATPTQQAVPRSTVGLPIIHVSDAIAIRDAGADDRELAVQGWFTPGNRAVRCAAPRVPQTSPIQLDCGDATMWLTRDPESLIHRTSNQTSHTEPQGPAIRPYLDNLDLPWQPADLGIDANGDSNPTDVVFVGHFDDRRAALCPEVQRVACLDRFVVDAVAVVGGVPQQRSEMHTGIGSSTVVDIEAIIANEAPESPILSMVVTQYPEDLAFIEPSLADGQKGLIDQPKLWIVRVLESERAVTYIVVDGTDTIYEMTQEGEAVLVGGTQAGPVATPAPFPPDNSVVIALTSPVGAGEPPVEVAVIDKSGRLVDVSEKGAVDPSTMSFDGRFGAYAEPGTPGRVHLTWVGGICDRYIAITVAADLGSITFDMGPQPDCDSIGVGRELVLDFDGSVDVPAIELKDVADAPVPVATSPAYQLDCGPLGPDTCEQKAAAIVAANATGSPAKRLESITFTDECGSYTVLFDDGTGMTASIDCILGGERRMERSLALERLRNLVIDRRAAESQASGAS
jgi:hypothetical protein